MVSTDLHRDCLDAERFAAWVDGGLTPEEAALVETHLADCARCQAMMAAFARTENAARAEAPARVLPFWRRGAVKWAVPLAAAASVAIWIAVSRDPQIPAASQSARVEPPPQMESAPAPIAAPTPAPAQQAQAESRGMRAISAPAVPPQLAVPPPPAVQPPPKVMSPPSVPPPTAVSSAPAVPAPPAVPPPPPPPPSAPPVTPSSALMRSEAVPSVVSEFTSEIPAARALSDTAQPAAAPGASGGRAGRTAAAAPPPLPSAPPLAPIRWRILSNGRVERSPVATPAWEDVGVDPVEQIVAGSAPSRLVCWLVGRRGAVLITINGGATFIEADVPGTVELATVRAIDARQATVTTTDGRTFTTTDAGVTWRPGP